MAGILAVVGATAIYLAAAVPHAGYAAAVMLTAVLAVPATMIIHRRHVVSSVPPLGYRIRATTYTYTFDAADAGRQRQDIETTIEAVRGNVGLFEAKYRYSGDGEVRLSLVEPTQILLTHPDMTYEGWTYYYVKLIRPLQPGETARITVRQEVEDPHRRMDFQVTKTVRRPMKELTLIVNFPAAGPSQKNIWAVERPNAMTDSSSARLLEIQYDSSEHQAKLHVEKPKPGRTYAIEWTWPEYRTTKSP
ncbi:hypothetical protein ACPCHT_30845 [Nucisporomicrobium flavum]|uniref:hypothetical protein n=1 Tax=Nucisporomicrobium flavum TaxID=2785915 RepID=UPI0018F61622|nr:hypothetical protein [Nucisporomicrobium flavum]